MKTFSLLLAWDNFPEGGTYGTVIEAENSDEAERLARVEMAEHRCQDEDDDPEDFLEQYADEWHLLDFVEGGDIWSALEEQRRLQALLSNANRDALLVGLNLLYLAMKTGTLSDQLFEILTNEGEHPALSLAEIDELCQELNQ